MVYESVVGLEVHVQLRTKSKLFCGCPNQSGSEPNTQVCPICLGYPGVLPVMNEEAIGLTVQAGLLIGCTINMRSTWDRKNYFYPDQPKNYQITQYDQPICLGGTVPVDLDGETKDVGITRIHLEEDVGKSMHFASTSGVDFNRAGTPLMEIVTEADMASADEAFAFLTSLKEILAYGEVSDCNLEEGNIRCDVNCSVRPVGQVEFGVKTEIKNMNTFKGVRRALSYEIDRQTSVLSKGGSIQQETRRWDDVAGMTHAMRSKEYAHDYRYFPEPDLMPVVLTDAQVQAWGEALPERPRDRRLRFATEYGLPDYDASVLVADKVVADFYEEAAKRSKNYKVLSNWVMTELLRALSDRNLNVEDVNITPAGLAELVGLVEDKTISSSVAKDVFHVLLEEGGTPGEIVKAKGWVQVSDTQALDAFVEEAIAANPKSVAAFRSGKENALQHVMGQVMRLSKGKANPTMVVKMLKERLNADV